MVTDATESVTTELFGLDGFEVLAGADAGGELELMIETTADLVPCPGCGAVATAKDRRPSWVADPPIAGRGGGAVLGQAGLDLQTSAVRGQDLDRAARGNRAAGAAHRPGSRGWGHRRGERVDEGRVGSRVRGVLAHDHAAGPGAGPPPGPGPGSPRRGHRDRRGRARLAAWSCWAAHPVRHRHRRSHPGPPRPAARPHRGSIRHRPANLAGHPSRRGEEADHYRGAGPACAGTPPRWATSYPQRLGSSTRSMYASSP